MAQRVASNCGSAGASPSQNSAATSPGRARLPPSRPTSGGRGSCRAGNPSGGRGSCRAGQPLGGPGSCRAGQPLGGRGSCRAGQPRSGGRGSRRAANPLGGRGSCRAGNPSGGRGSCRAVGFSSQAAVRLSGSFALPKGQHPWQCNLQLRTGFRVDPFFAPQTAPRRAQQERKHSRRFSSVEFSEGNAGEGNAKAPPRRSAFCRKWRQRTFRSQPQMIPCTTVPGCPSSRLPVPLARRNVCCSCPSPNRCSSVA